MNMTTENFPLEKLYSFFFQFKQVSNGYSQASWGVQAWRVLQ
jgi:hypothetical protein